MPEEYMERERHPSSGSFCGSCLLKLSCLPLLLVFFAVYQSLLPTTSTLLFQLEQRGAAVQELHLVPDTYYYFQGTPHLLLIDGETVTAYDAPLSFLVDLEVSRSPNCININGSTFEYVYNADVHRHFYAKGRLIVLYDGTKPEVIHLLTNIMGPQFMGCG